ncbi:hypothetical protein K501DRAFT_280509 [Backusella circina FSU 941]|nr:hypothetical protein K501DRAFT_280509 [Backusella circina FSU 941]
MGPSKDINFSPSHPKLAAKYIGSILNDCFLGISNYWRLLKRFDFNQKHERAFEVLCVSPLFKHFSTMSKGPYSIEYIDHSIGNTWKLIKMAINSLRNEILKYQNT